LNLTEFTPLWISLKTTVAATALILLLALPAAHWRVRQSSRWAALVDGVILLPLVLPPTVVGFGLLLLFGRQSPLGRALHDFGAAIVFSWPATVIAAAVVAFPFLYLAARGALQQIDPHALEAARTLGAGESRIFFRIALPLALPGILAGTALAFARALGEFGATLMLAGNIPGRTQTLSVAVFFAVEAGDYAAAARWSALLALFSLAIVAALHAWMRGERANAGRAWRR
jgi:molybdate transport system permease protein